MTATDTELDWASHARTLADRLRDAGDIHSPAWHTAVADTPRHVFVPHAYTQDDTGQWNRWDTAGQLDRVYSPVTLVTAIEPRESYQLPISSSTTPALMLRMLETLDVHDHHRVLEIGTGTGYNAALLSHRVGDQQVFSVDVEHDLVDLARERLAGIGRHPTLAAHDGADGLPEQAPFDRIIATCSVPVVPSAWADQLTPDGTILVDVRTAISAGNLVHLHRHGDTLRGRFTTRAASFMAMRHKNEPPRPQPAARAMPEARSTTRLSEPWSHGVPWFLATFWLPPNPLYGRTFGEDGVWWTVTADDGSRVAVAADPVDGQREVIQSGPCRIWDEIEQAFTAWQEMGSPGWDRFGLTVTPERQWVWLDDPHSEPIAELPVRPDA
jgi:protein-L-isoaspartate(D-aspartate) O-methyltransferase